MNICRNRSRHAPRNDFLVMSTRDYECISKVGSSLHQQLEMHLHLEIDRAGAGERRGRGETRGGRESVWLCMEGEERRAERNAREEAGSTTQQTRG